MKACFEAISLTVPVVLISLGCLGTTMAQDNSIIVSPTSLSFCVVASNSPAPPAQTLAVTASGSSAVGFTANAVPSWVRLNGGTVPIVGDTFSAPTITVTIDPSAYSSGSNAGLIQIDASNVVNAAVSVTVSPTCSSTVPLTPAPTSVNFSTAQTSQAVMIGGPAAAQITATPIYGATNPTGWFSLSSTSLVAFQGVTVSLVSANLPSGTTGSILFTQNGTANSISVPVTYTTAGGTGNGVYTANPSSISPNFTNSQAESQTGMVTIMGPSASLTTTVNPGTGPTGWIAATQPQGVILATIQVTVNPASLPAGTTYGSVIVSLSGTGNFVVIPVSATIQTEAYTYNPSPFTFSITGGSSIQQNQTLTISGPNNAQVVATAQIYNGGYQWLTFSGNTSAYATVTNSSLPLLVTVNPSNLAASQTFSGAIIVTQGSSTVLDIPVTVTTLPFTEPLDFTRSGHAGALLYDPVLGTAYTALSNGNGSYQYVYNLFTPGFDTLRSGDFNGDEKADVALYNSQTALGYVGLSDGDGTFSFQSLFWSPGFDFVEPGDLNGDGKTDFALYNSSNGTLYTAISNGTGGFTYNYSLISPGYTYIRLANFTGSGKAGLFLYNASTGVAFLGIGEGFGTFTFHSLFWSLAYDYVVPEDIDGDGKIDIVLYNSATGTVYTGISNGDGTFTYIYQYWGIGKVLAR